ncbi:MAG: hypothetical protein JW795_23775 [Chitinivibrionales bacterium]|nr:hypothetical protein [Chitinivibrionales bacterium]
MSQSVLTRVFVSCCVMAVFSICYGQQEGYRYILDEFGNPTNLINANPDPFGEPWVVGGAVEFSAEELRMTPQLELPAEIMSRSLPSKVDNTGAKAFRPVFNQIGGSCAQASGIAYSFTYEINGYRGLSSQETANQYPYGYTYNFTNRGSSSNGSNSSQGFSIVLANGCPTIPDYGGSINGGNATYWPSGYDKYYKGMSNKIKDQFQIKVNTAEGLTKMKQWLYDHGGNGSNFGGTVVFACNFTGRDEKKLPSGSPEAGFSVVLKWGTGGGHAMTFAGYNDSIYYDVNGDGAITTAVDITRDGQVDLRDAERGGVLLVNSHGTGYGTKGKAYCLYSLLAKTQEEGGVWSNVVYGFNVYKEYKPKMVCKLSVTHEKRDSIKITAGMSNDPQAAQPKETKSFGSAFNYAGGSFPMCGSGNSSTIEIGLDVTELYQKVTSATSKFFIKIDSKGNSGTANSFTLMDYTDQTVKEFVSADKDVTLKSGTTYLSVQRIGATPVFTPQPKLAANNGMSPATIQSGSIQVFLPRSGTYMISILSVNGRMMHEIFHGFHNQGNAMFSYNKNRLPAGAYLLSISSGENRMGNHNIGYHRFIVL